MHRFFAWPALVTSWLLTTPVWSEVSTSAPSLRSSENPTVMVFNHGFDFPHPYERRFTFSAVPSTQDWTTFIIDGIRVNAPGRPFRLLDGSLLNERVARQPDAGEWWEIELPPDSHLFEFRMWESTNLGVGPNTCFDFDQCIDTLYEIRVLSGASLLETVNFSPYDDEVNKVVVWSSAPITQIEMRAVTNNTDDEFLGDLRVSSAPLPDGLDVAFSASQAEFGDAAAVQNSRALIGDAAGLEFWQRGRQGWQSIGRVDLADTIQRVALGAGHAAVAVTTPADQRLRIYRVIGGDPSLWPFVELPFGGTLRDMHIEGDVIALGLDGRVAIYRRVSGQNWALDQEIPADSEVPSPGDFARSIGLDDGLLAVDAGGGRFRIYQEGAGLPFSEVFRQNQSFTVRSHLAMANSTVVVQTFEGGLRIFEPDGNGGWAASQFPFTGLPGEIGLALGEGLRKDGDTFIALRGFQISPSPTFRRIISIWKRNPAGQFVRSGLFVEPHKQPTGETLMGAAGRAFALGGEDILIGHPRTSWCRRLPTSQAFLGEPTAFNFNNVCGGNSGMVYFLDATRYGDSAFADRFETEH